MTPVKLYLFGPPRLEREGAPVEVDTRKALALIAFLTVTGESHSRDALAGLLWPEYDQTRARAALRRTLSTLNKALAGAGLEIDRETVALDPQAAPSTCGVGQVLWVDVNRFQRLVAGCRAHGHPVTEPCPGCLSTLVEAVDLYRADFLAGFSLRDSSDFDEWQFFQSESLRRELAGALEGLVRCYTAQGAFETAIGYARRWLSLDPLHEPVHRQLMQLYAWAGQRAAALRQYRECVRILDQELGVPPLEETTGLYTAIQENRLPPPQLYLTPAPARSREAPLAAPVPAEGSPEVYPLVGRAAEWARVRQAYDATGVDGHVLSLEGEAGIGKTRLAEEFLDYARARGAVVMTARCYEGEVNLAYAPFIEGLRAGLARPAQAAQLARLPDHWLSEAARLLPELADLRPGLAAAPPLDSPGAQSRFFEGISQVLLAISQGARPGILCLDDVHWADAASLALLTYLVRRLQGRSLFLVLTWRSENVPAGHPLRQLLAETRRTGRVTLLALSRLDQAAVRELVEAVVLAGGGGSAADLLRAGRPAGQGNPAALAKRLYQETEGLPFFMVEYLAMMSQAGEPAGPDDWAMPGGVRGLLQSRLAAVSETGWQLLTTAAVIGRSFDFDTLRVASGRSDDETVIALEALIEQGLVVEIPGSGGGGLRYDFSHEKLRALVYEQASLARRRLLHRRVAEALVGRARNRHEMGALAGQIAQHSRLAGQEGEAAEYFLLAGEHARRLYANAEALEAFRAALALGYPEAAAVQEAIGDLQTLTGEYSAALTSYETAAALASGPALANLERKLGNLHHRRGEWDLAESYFQAGLRVLGEVDQAGEGARIYVDWSLTAHHSGQTARAVNLAQQARALAETAGDTRALAQVHNILGILARSHNDPELACQHLEQSLALAESLGDPSVRIAALNNLALAYGTGGEIDRAVALAEQALALCHSQGDRHREAALHNNLADLFHAAGQTEAAMAHLKQAVTIFAEVGAEAGTPSPEIWKLSEW